MRTATLGATLLDAKLPGWEAKIDTDQLTMYRMDMCILGQLYGHYTTGLGELFPGDPLLTHLFGVASDYGFSVPGHVDLDDAKWQDLTTDWLIEIAERRALVAA